MASRLLLAATAGLSGCSVYLSYMAIQNVRAWEESANRAAQISNTADEQVKRTWSTESVSAVASLLSTVTATTFALYPSQSHKLHLAFALFNAAATMIASDHMMRFWYGKAKVPLAQQYNDAIDYSNNLRRVLLGLTVFWLFDAGLQSWNWIMQ